VPSRGIRSVREPQFCPTWPLDSPSNASYGFSSQWSTCRNFGECSTGPSSLWWCLQSLQWVCQLCPWRWFRWIFSAGSLTVECRPSVPRGLRGRPWCTRFGSAYRKRAALHAVHGCPPSCPSSRCSVAAALRVRRRSPLPPRSGLRHNCRESLPVVWEAKRVSRAHPGAWVAIFRGPDIVKAENGGGESRRKAPYGVESLFCSRSSKYRLMSSS